MEFHEGALCFYTDRFVLDPLLMASVENRPQRYATTTYLIPGLCSSQRYTVRRGDPKIETRYTHRILFKDDSFTCDGYNYRKVKDRANASFLKSLEECGCPDEFEGEGVHRIWIHRRPGDMGWDKSEGEFNTSKYLKDDRSWVLDPGFGIFRDIESDSSEEDIDYSNLFMD